MDSPPVLLEVGSSERGDAYVAAMELAGEYAYAARRRRQGAGRRVVILEGVASPDADESLHSTVHRRRPRDEPHPGRRPHASPQALGVHHRDCTRIFDIDGISPTAGVPKSGICPDHPTSSMRKVWIEEQVSPGRIDWPAVQERLRQQGIVLVGGGADEAPEVYKRLPDVLAAHGDALPNDRPARHGTTGSDLRVTVQIRYGWSEGRKERQLRAILRLLDRAHRLTAPSQHPPGRVAS